MPPIPPLGMAGAGDCFLGTSATIASVVMSRPAIEAAFFAPRPRIGFGFPALEVQLIIVVRGKTFRHWLNALAITGPDQPRNVKRTHPPPCLVTQALQKRLEPASKLGILPSVRALKVAAFSSRDLDERSCPFEADGRSNRISSGTDEARDRPDVAWPRPGTATRVP
jgi:hypothetical protein